MSAKWKGGDRVLAPWEPEFLYPGTVRYVGRKGVMVEFDDGDEGLVPGEALLPIRIKAGAQLQARRVRDELIYEWAEVLQVDGERLRVRYVKDGAEDELQVEHVRIPHPDAFGDEGGSEVVPGLWKEGDRVLAPWEPGTLYPGTIRRLQSSAAMIEYDDGDVGPAPLSRLQPIHLEPGTMVQARRERFEMLYDPATVIAADGEELTIRYAEDGYEEQCDIAYVRVPARQ